VKSDKNIIIAILYCMLIYFEFKNKDMAQEWIKITTAKNGIKYNHQNISR